MPAHAPSEVPSPPSLVTGPGNGKIHPWYFVRVCLWLGRPLHSQATCTCSWVGSATGVGTAPASCNLAGATSVYGYGYAAQQQQVPTSAPILKPVVLPSLQPPSCRSRSILYPVVLRLHWQRDEKSTFTSGPGGPRPPNISITAPRSLSHLTSTSLPSSRPLPDQRDQTRRES